jgi:FixJ family two-component response regulator
MARGRVYLVEDDIPVRKALHRLIHAAGFEVASFDSAAAYLGAPKPRLPACLVLDIRMPAITGFELQSAISGTDRDVPIVFITGHGGEDVRAQARASGAVDLLFKPVDERPLVAAIERAARHLARGRRGSSLNDPPRRRRPDLVSGRSQARAGLSGANKTLPAAGTPAVPQTACRLRYPAKLLQEWYAR